MTKIEIIKETAAYYNLKNRGYVEEIQNCEYLTSDGLKCAVGRCIKDDAIEMFAMDWNDAAVTSMNSAELDKVMKPEYQGHNINFWQAIQNFHDLACHWNAEGLTDQGRVEYNRLLEEFEGQ